MLIDCAFKIIVSTFQVRVLSLTNKQEARFDQSTSCTIPNKAVSIPACSLHDDQDTSPSGILIHDQYLSSLSTKISFVSSCVVHRSFMKRVLCLWVGPRSCSGAIYGTAVNLAFLYKIIITRKVKTEPRRHNMIIQDKCYDFNLICFVQAIAGRPSILVLGGYTFYL